MWFRNELTLLHICLRDLGTGARCICIKTGPNVRQKYQMHLHGPPLPALTGPGQGVTSAELHNKQCAIYQPRGAGNPTWTRILRLSFVIFPTLRFLARNGLCIHFFTKHFQSTHVERKAEKSQLSRGTGILRAQRWKSAVWGKCPSPDLHSLLSNH